MVLFPTLLKIVKSLDFSSISKERKEILQVLIDYIKSKKGEEVNLNFVCTHNSRRSQFSQIWAKTAADYFNVNANCFSGGVEVTSFNERAVDSIKRFGFVVTSEGEVNPKYSVYYAEGIAPIITFSKLVEDKVNPSSNFATIMTCSHADENCPFIVGADQRIPIRYTDPKAFDDTEQESEKYDERSLQIATEMFYIFSKIN